MSASDRSGGEAAWKRTHRAVWVANLATAVGMMSFLPFFPSHLERFPHGRSGPLWGVGVQAVIMVAAVVVVLALRPY